jgi:hypothetical protein
VTHKNLFFTGEKQVKKQLYTIPMLLLIVSTLLLSGCAGMQAAQSDQANYPAFPVSNTTDGAAANSAPGSGNPQTIANQPGDNYPTPAANQPGAGRPAQDPNNPAPLAGVQPNLPLSVQLALGTLKLEGTAQAVTAEQAAKLLPLWQEAFAMSQSSDVKVADLELIFTQIQSVMTSEQMATIQSMEVGSEEIAALAQNLGIEHPSMNPATLTPDQLATMQASGQNAPPPGNGGPGGGNLAPQGTPPAGGNSVPRGTPPAGGAQLPAGNGNPPPAGAPGEFEKAFFQAMIDLLTEKLQ